jgi:hypothetical protein
VFRVALIVVESTENKRVEGGSPSFDISEFERIPKPVSARMGS